MLYENPALHDRVSVHDGITLRSDTECILVYEASGTTKSVKEAVIYEGSMDSERKRRVVKGPALFFPAVGDLVHEFKWSSTNGGSELIKERNMFKVLNIGASRTWNVTILVSTSDQSKFSVSLSFRYDVECLNSLLLCEDPIETVFTALRSDGQALGNSLTDDRMIRAGTADDTSLPSQLASLKTYPNFVTAATSVGLAMKCVAVTDIRHSEKLQMRSDEEKTLMDKLRADRSNKSWEQEVYELELKHRFSFIGNGQTYFNF